MLPRFFYWAQISFSAKLEHLICGGLDFSKDSKDFGGFHFLFMPNREKSLACFFFPLSTRPRSAG